VLAALVTASLTSGEADAGRLDAGAAGGLGGVLEAAGLLFFAFAGYARITTLGEEVRDPARTIPRAVPIALGIALACYTAVALSVLAVLGPERLAGSAAPLTAAAETAEMPGLAAAVRAGAVLAALGALLALLLGVSRTVLAMARDRHLPGVLAAVHPRFAVPHRAELVVGAVVAVVAATADVRGAIGFSSFAVLVYYAVANAAALTLDHRRWRLHRLTAAVGLGGCVTLAAALPVPSVIAGSAVLAVLAAVHGGRRAVAAARR
jgi:APA family basic amino acid/polyamine antiporter